MSLITGPPDRHEFHVALICALPLEASSLLPLFDHIWDVGEWQTTNPRGDHNHYTAGRMKQHNVVLAHMPNIGTVAASSVAASLKGSFPNIQLALVVGICGAMPLTPDGTEIILGDVIISESVVQYDFGRLYPYGFQKKNTVEDNLGRQSPSIRAFLAKLKTEFCMSKIYAGINENLEMLCQNSALRKDPGPSMDKLFQSSYLHKHRGPAPCDQCDQYETMICAEATQSSCEVLGCEEGSLITRVRLQDNTERIPKIHFGRYGSGNTVLKSGMDRDSMAMADGIIALEMEGAGVWEQLPTIIVKGVCDYADSHKTKGWQRYAATTAAACVKTMLEQWSAEETAIFEPILPKSSLMPYTPCTNYVDRAAYSAKLQDFFNKWKEGPRRFVLWGLGGIGKTQITLKFVTSKMSQLRVFWVRADKTENFLIDYRKILEMLNPELYLSIPHDDPAATFKATLTELERDPSSWLLVLDNADDIDNFRKQPGDRLCLGEYIPRTGRVLITTRDSRLVGEIAEASNGLEVRSMSEGEGELLLQASLPNDLQEDVDDDKANSTAELLTELGYLPLAIAQAAANMRHLQTPLSEYVQLYREKRTRMELLSQPVHDPRLPPQSVLVTWQISFEHIRSSSPPSANLLGYLGFLHWQSIPMTLLQWLPEFKKLSNIGFKQVVARLLHLSLVEKVDKDVFQLHPLVHYWLSARMDIGERKRYLEPVLNLVSAIFPVSADTERGFAAYITPHAIELIHQAEECQVESTAFAILMQRVATFVATLGLLELANSLISRAMKIGIVVYEPDDVSLIYLRKYQGRIHMRSANYAIAASDFEKCLNDLGTVNTTQDIVNNERINILQELIIALRNLHKYDRITDLQNELSEARTAAKERLGSDNTDELKDKALEKHNRAHNLMRRGFIDDAKSLNDEVINFAEHQGKKVIPDSLHLVFLNCRAHIMLCRNNQHGALEIFRKVFTRSLEILNVNDIDFWIAAVNIQSVQLELKKWTEMETTFAQIFERISLDSLSGIHSEKAMNIINTMAIAKQHLGKYQEAEYLHKAALRICLDLMNLWNTEASSSSIDNAIATPRQHPWYYIFLYNICLATARQGRMEEMRSIRDEHRDEVTKAEAQFKSIETRLEQDKENENLYIEAQQRLAREGRRMFQSQWWKDHQTKIETASYRLGPLVDSNNPVTHETDNTTGTSGVDISSLSVDEGFHEPHEPASAQGPHTISQPAANDAKSTQAAQKPLTWPILSRIRSGFRKPKQK